MAETSVELFIDINLLAVNLFSWRLWLAQVIPRFFFCHRLFRTLLASLFATERALGLVCLDRVTSRSDFLLGDSVSTRWRGSHQPWQSGESILQFKLLFRFNFWQATWSIMSLRQRSFVISLSLWCNWRSFRLNFAFLSNPKEFCNYTDGYHFVTSWPSYQPQPYFIVLRDKCWTVKHLNLKSRREASGN